MMLLAPRDFIKIPSSHRLKLSTAGILQGFERFEWLRNDLPSVLPSTRLRSKDNERRSPAIVPHRARRMSIRIPVLESENDVLIKGEI